MKGHPDRSRSPNKIRRARNHLFLPINDAVEVDQKSGFHNSIIQNPLHCSSLRGISWCRKGRHQRDRCFLTSEERTHRQRHHRFSGTSSRQRPARARSKTFRRSIRRGTEWAHDSESTDSAMQRRIRQERRLPPSIHVLQVRILWFSPPEPRRWPSRICAQTHAATGRLLCWLMHAWRARCTGFCSPVRSTRRNEMGWGQLK